MLKPEQEQILFVYLKTFKNKDEDNCCIHPFKPYSINIQQFISTGYQNIQFQGIKPTSAQRN